MFGDDDPEIASFFANFLGDAPRRASPVPSRTTRRDRRARPEVDGLAVGLAGAAAILEQGSQPRGVRVHAERTEVFNQMLQEMANDIMENGPHVESARSVSPAPRARSASPSDARSVDDRGWPDQISAEQRIELSPDGEGSDEESDIEQPVKSAPQSAECMPDEFEDLPQDAWTFPHVFRTTTDSAWPGPADKPDPAWPEPGDKARQGSASARKVAHSPPPPAAAALAASSRLKGSDLSYAPTPSRRLPGHFRALNKGTK